MDEAKATRRQIKDTPVVTVNPMTIPSSMVLPVVISLKIHLDFDLKKFMKLARISVMIPKAYAELVLVKVKALRAGTWI